MTTTSLQPGSCPVTVPVSVMRMRWERLAFVHWDLEPEAVQQVLPPGLEVDLHDGRAWVGLVPFFMRVGLPRTSAPPWLGRFPETNVRTYVRDAHGRPGVWFCSLEASRLAAVATARATYRLPYFWAGMSLVETPDQVRYETRRRWPGPRGVGGSVVVTKGAPVPAADVTELEHFLTARWRLFSSGPRGSLRYAEVDHEPWPLHRGQLVSLDDRLVRAAGLPAPAGEPLVHWSPGVDVRIGPPRRV